MQDAMSKSSSNSVKDSGISEVVKETHSGPSSPDNNQTDERTISQLQTSFMTDNSDSDEDEVSEVESFLIDQGEYEEGQVLDSKFLLSSESPSSLADCSPCTDLRNVDPVTQAKLAALLEAAGLGKLSAAADGKQYSDPEVLRKLTSSVSCALDEAAATLNRMRAENSGQISNSSDGRSLAEACSDGDMKAVKMLLDEGHSSVHETTEEGESLLSFACSSGYFELAHILLLKKANVDDRGIKGDCTPLMGASSGGHVDIVKLLIAHGADVNAQSQSGNTPLMCACAGGHQNVVGVLLQSGANVEDHNENGHTPLMEAASAGHVPVAKILLEHGAGINTHSNEFKESALTLACYKGHLEMVRFLLEAGADQEHKTDEMHTALMEASMDGHVEVARLLLDSGAQVNMPADSFESPLTLAACGGHVELAMLLLERGANIEEVNDEGYTPLMEASREGHEEMVALLLSQGADINAQTEETQETALTLACCGGFLEVAEFLIKAGANIELGASSPLMEAAQEGHLELVRYLLDAGSNVNTPTTTGDTALTYACENGHTDVADLLLQAGAYLEHESEGGRTPLMKAARSGHLCTVQFLISRGADINRRTTNNDHTPLSLACAGGHLAVVELLLAHGSDPAHKLKDNSTMLIEAAKGGHTNVVQLLLDYPNSMLASPPPPPPPAVAESIAGVSTAIDQNIEPPRVPPHGLQVVQSDTPIVALPQGNASIAANQSYLHDIQSAGVVDPFHLRDSVQLSALQPPNVRANLPVQRSVLRTSNSNHPSKPAAPVPNNIVKQDMALTTPRLVQLIKNYQQQAAMVNVASELSFDFEKSLVDGVNHAAAVAAASMGLDLSTSGVDEKDLRPSERLEACINNMMKKAEMMHHNREEQILQKQQILEELQRVERELQEKAQAQILLNTQYRLDHIHPNVPISSQSINTPSSVFDDTVKSFPSTVSKSDAGSKGQLNLNLKSVPSEDPCNVTSVSTAKTSTKASAVPAMKYKIPRLSGSAKVSLPNFEDEEVNLSNVKLNDLQDLEDNSDTNVDGSAGLPSSNSSISTSNHITQSTTTATSTDTTSVKSSLTSVTSSKSSKISDMLADAVNVVPNSQVVTTTSVSTTSSNKAKSKSKQQNKMQVNMGVGSRSLLTNLPVESNAVPTNHIAGTAQYSPSPFASNQASAQVQTAMALAAQAYIPQSSSCNVATQCMVDPCLMNQTGTGIAESPSIPIPFLPSTNQSPSSPQTSPSLYPPIDIGKFDIDSQTESNHDTALTLACAGGHEELVTLLLQRGANIEHRDKKGFTPLILAATAGHSTVVEILLNNMAEIEAQSERTKDTPLSLACSGGRYEVVEILLTRGANKEHRNVSDYTPLSLAASGGYVNIIKLLLNSGAEINSRTGSKLGISPLMLAAMNGHTAAVKLLLDMGSDINAQIETNRNTALTLACFQGRHEVVSLLVDRKANIEHRAKTGLTPLMEAASGGYTEVGQVLLDKGADVNAPPVPSSRDTALTIAADKGHYRFVGLLLSRGAAVDVKNKKGNSPLWLSCNGGHLDVVQLLVSMGADIDSQDNRKVSCLMAAFRRGHIKVVKWMVKHVSQFPSDQECTRYIATISDKDILKKCHQCMEIIRTAKDRQEAEANKNATILLEELDMEKSREESKKAAAARRRERKRLKRKEKQAVKDLNPKEESENLKNETKNRVVEEKIKDTIVEKIKTPILPPGVTLTPIKVGECLPPKREEKNTVSIMKIETTTSSTEPMVTNMGTVIVVETKSSTVSQNDQSKSNNKSQSMITISRINSNTVTVSSSHPDGNNLVSISAATSAKQVNCKSKAAKNEISSSTISKVLDKVNTKVSKESKKQEKPSKEKQSNKENKPSKERSSTKQQVVVAVSCSASTSTTATISSSVSRHTNTSTKTTLTSSNSSNRSNKKKDEKQVSNNKKKDHSLKDDNDEQLVTNELYIEPLSTTGIGDLDDFGSLPDNHNQNMRGNKSKTTISTLNSFSNLPLDVHELEPPNETSPTLRSPNSLVNALRSPVGVSNSSPKKNQKKEDGWKEVVRRSKKVSVPSNAISRVIGRGGCNINAIREVSSAHIEVEKQRGAGDRTIIIRGSAESTRQAHQLITALIKDPERELFELLPKASVAAISCRAENKNSTNINVTTTSKSKSSTLPASGLSIYSTPPFPATSVIKQQQRPGIPTTSLSNVGAAFPANQGTQSWPAFSSPVSSSASSGRKNMPNEANLSKSPAVRQLFPETAIKSVPNQISNSVSKTIASYTTAVMAPGNNTKTVTTVNTSMSVYDYKTNQPPRLMNQQNHSSKYDNSTQFKPMINQNGSIRVTATSQNNSNSSSGSSGSPIAQDYSPFNSIFSKVAQQSVWGNQKDGIKGMNFASVAASGVVSLASQNSVMSALHQSSISSTSPNNVSDTPLEPIDVAKAPGYRGNGSHMSPGSNSTESGHYSAPNTPPICPIGTPSHNSAGHTGQPSPAIPSPPVRPSSLPEQSSVNEKSASLASPASGINSLRVSTLHASGSDKTPITNVPSSYMGNSIPSASHGGILSVASLAPGGPVACHAQVNVINSIGNHPRLPNQQPLSHPGQAIYPSRFVNPATLPNLVFTQNAVNVSMQSSNNPHFPNNNIIQSNLNPNAPDFSSRSNGTNILHPNILARMQPQSYIEANLNHQSAFRPPMMQNPSYPQQNTASGFPSAQPNSSVNKLPFIPSLPGNIPLDMVSGLNPETAAAAAVHLMNANRQQSMNNSESFSHMHNPPPHENNIDAEQRPNSNSGTDPSINQTNNLHLPVSQGVSDDRKSFPRPIGTERAHRKTPVYSGVSDVKGGIWSYNNSDPNTADWMSTLPYLNTSKSLTVNNDESKLPPSGHVLSNGMMPNFPAGAGTVLPGSRINHGDNLSLPSESSHPIDPIYQAGGVSNQTNNPNHFNSIPSRGSSYMKNLPPNPMMAVMNQHLYNNASSVNGPSSDFWMSAKLPTSVANINHSSTSQPDQKPVKFNYSTLNNVDKF